MEYVINVYRELIRYGICVMLLPCTVPYSAYIWRD